jgi:hypothetical protein
LINLRRLRRARQGIHVSINNRNMSDSHGNVEKVAVQGLCKVQLVPRGGVIKNVLKKRTVDSVGVKNGDAAVP